MQPDPFVIVGAGMQPQEEVLDGTYVVSPSYVRFEQSLGLCQHIRALHATAAPLVTDYVPLLKACHPSA